eukprot:7332200-Prymnesium_polylepis.2
MQMQKQKRAQIVRAAPEFERPFCCGRTALRHAGRNDHAHRRRHWACSSGGRCSKHSAAAPMRGDEQFNADQQQFDASCATRRHHTPWRGCPPARRQPRPRSR